MELYLVAAILNPTKKQKDDDGAIPQIVVPLQAVLARDDGHATAKALRLVPEEHQGKDDRIDVRVMHFRGAAVAAGR